MPPIQSGLQDLIHAGNWWGVMVYLWVATDRVPWVHVLLIGVPILFLSAALLAGAAASSASTTTRRSNANADLEPSSKAYKPRGPQYIPVQLDKVVVDLQPKLGGSLHMAVVGPTGLGKSTAVLSLFDLDIGVWCVALDNTRPVRKKVLSVGGTDWTNDPRECSLGLDLLNISTPAATAELVVSGLPKATGDSGQWRRAAIARIMVRLAKADRDGKPRTWRDMLTALQEDTQDRPADMACKEWASKLEQVYMLCGQNFGTDLNLVTAMRNREKVLTRTNHFLSGEVGPMVGGWLMLLARLVAHEANMPFVLIVEEANQAELFKAYITPISQAARDRDVVLVAIGQSGSKLPPEVVQNIKVWACTPQGNKAERAFCAEQLGIDPERMRISEFPKTNPPSDQGLGWFFVGAPGLPTSLMHLPDQNVRVLRRSRDPVVTSPQTVASDVEFGIEEVEEVADEQGVETEAETTPIPQLSIVEPIPWWTLNDPKFEEWFTKCRRVGPSILWHPRLGVWYDERGCLEWTGTVTKPTNGAPARPRSNYRRQGATPYRKFFEAFYGWDGRPTLDHMCDNPLCCEPTHIWECSVEDNTRYQAQREKIFKLAGWLRLDRDYEQPGQKTVRVARWEGKLPIAA